MKFPKLTLSLAALASFSVSSAVMAAKDAELCSPVSAKVTKAVAADSASVLKIVAEEVAASPKCACEVVKAAISASSADKALVVSIVEAAAAAAPSELPVVLACAATASPEAAADLANAFSKETEGSGKGVVGKEPVGKGPVSSVTEEEVTDDFGLIRPGVGGIYLTIPTGNGGRFASELSDLERLLNNNDFKRLRELGFIVKDGKLVPLKTTTVVVKPGRPIFVPVPGTGSGG